MKINPFDITHDSYDFHCPSCNQGLTTSNWTTEYGDAMSGDYYIECPDCGHKFSIEVRNDITYKVGHG